MLFLKDFFLQENRKYSFHMELPHLLPRKFFSSTFEKAPNNLLMLQYLFLLCLLWWQLLLLLLLFYYYNFFFQFTILFYYYCCFFVSAVKQRVCYTVSLQSCVTARSRTQIWSLNISNSYSVGKIQLYRDGTTEKCFKYFIPLSVS